MTNKELEKMVNNLSDKIEQLLSKTPDDSPDNEDTGNLESLREDIENLRSGLETRARIVDKNLSTIAQVIFMLIDAVKEIYPNHSNITELAEDIKNLVPKMLA